MRKHLLTTTATMLLAMTGVAFADMDAAKAFLDTEIGDLSTLSRADQEKELQWWGRVNTFQLQWEEHFVNVH